MIRMNSHYAMLQLPSQPQNVAQLDVLVKNLVCKYKLSNEVSDNILITLTEAVSNAIIHGNHCDCSKMVVIKMKKLKDKLAIQVSDQGCGFTYDELPDPTSPDNIHRPGGRGVFIMQRLCDRLSFQNGGSTVELQFNI